MRFMSTVAAFSAALLAGSMALADASHQVRGDLSSFDAASRTLVVKETSAPRKEVRLTLGDSAKIIALGKPGTTADLKAGERVKVSYTDQGATHQATRVEILPEKAATTKKS
jgi:hypothetical protein